MSTLQPNKHFNIIEISKSRDTLMGLAIIWIVFYHFGLDLKPINIISRYGYTGVDIFMFLSGFGLFYSLSKNENIKLYYIKRLKRILPTYFFVGIFFSLYCFHDSIEEYLWKCSTIGYWFGKSHNDYFEWYIPSIISCYLFFPLIYHTSLKEGINKNRIIYLITFFILLSVSVVVFKWTDTWHFLYIYRIPIFLLGAYVAKRSMHRTQSSAFFVKLALWSIIPFLLLYLGGKYLNEIELTFFSTTWLCPLLLIIIIKLNILKRWEIIKTIGKASLEIYLVHVVIMLNNDIQHLPYRILYNDISTIVLAIVSIILGILLHNLVSKCIH